MIGNVKGVFSGNGSLQGFNLVIFKFNDLTAFRTDQMIMMIRIAGGFITGKSVSETPKGSESGFSKEFHCTVGGGKTNTGSSFLDLTIDLFGTDVTAVLKKGPCNQFPLGGQS